MARRGRQLSRLLLVLAIALAFLAGAVEVYRGASLIGLPDVGDPFDVAQFRAFRIPPENDAFVLFRQAQKKLSQMPHLPLAVRRLGPMEWSKSARELRDWVAANRDVLEMFRAASERPDGIALPNPDRDDGDDQLKLGLFVELIRLEASRLEELGDMAGAWNCYRGPHECSGCCSQTAATTPGEMARRHSRRENAAFHLALAIDSRLRATRVPQPGRAAGQ